MVEIHSKVVETHAKVVETGLKVVEKGARVVEKFIHVQHFQQTTSNVPEIAVSFTLSPLASIMVNIQGFW